MPTAYMIWLLGGLVGYLTGDTKGAVAGLTVMVFFSVLAELHTIFKGTK